MRLQFAVYLLKKIIIILPAPSFSDCPSSMFVSGDSRLPIIHFLLEFRLSPWAGAGEDWVSLVIPYHGQARVQSYLLRGLTAATSYQARIRTKTRHGVSSYSPTWQFTTWSPWTTSSPVTVFSLPRTDQAEQRETQWEHISDQTKQNFAKGKGKQDLLSIKILTQIFLRITII